MRSPKLELVPASKYPLAALADLFTRCFAGYFVEVRDTAELLALRLRVDSTDLHLSQVATDGNHPVGIILLSPRGQACRVSGMGVSESHRGQGIGRRLIEHATANLAERSYRLLVLEVIEQNQAALALYRSVGFAEQRRLVGFKRAARDLPQRAPEPAQLIEVDARQVATEVATEATSDLPWQVAAESLLSYTPPARAFRLGDGATALLSDPAGPTVLLQAVVVRRQLRRQGWGRRLLEALEGRFPDRTWLVPARLPEGLADDFFAQLGFEPHALSQLEMELDLTATDLCQLDGA